MAVSQPFSSCHATEAALDLPYHGARAVDKTFTACDDAGELTSSTHRQMWLEAEHMAQHMVSPATTSRCH